MSADPRRGIAQIMAAEEGGEGRLGLWFDLPRLVLRRVVKLAGDRRIDLILHAGAEPYFGWSPAYPVIFDWPQIPESRQEIKREFTNDDDLPVEETIRFSPGQFEITMTLNTKVDAGYRETRRSTQVWAEGSPWWSRASIETGYNIDGQTSRELNIAGRLI